MLVVFRLGPYEFRCDPKGQSQPGSRHEDMILPVFLSLVKGSSLCLAL